jgi:hypothetical protein
VTVTDPFGAGSDPFLPTVTLALDPEVATKNFKHGLPRLAGEGGRVKVKSICVTRYKPGRRCVIEYDVRVERPGSPRERVQLIGKVRARRFGNEGYRMLDAVWNAGFDAHSADGVSVPEPVGVLPRLQMWVQRKAAGREATSELCGPGGIALARRIAEAAHKLHTAGVSSERSHVMADELRVLRSHLPRAADARPALRGRIERLLDACDQLGAGIDPAELCGIHRDFYPAQVLVDGHRLFLLDFDLYCRGDPALDIGNFSGHLLELAVRQPADARRFLEAKEAMEDRFAELAGRRASRRVETYTTLTLARHVFLSTQFPERLPFTEAILEQCEERFGSHKGVHKGVNKGVSQ